MSWHSPGLLWLLLAVPLLALLPLWSWRLRPRLGQPLYRFAMFGCVVSSLCVLLTGTVGCPVPASS